MPEVAGGYAGRDAVLVCCPCGRYSGSDMASCGFACCRRHSALVRAL